MKKYFKKIRQEKYKLNSIKKIHLGLVDELDELVTRNKQIVQELNQSTSQYVKQDKILQKVYQKRIEIEAEYKVLQQNEEIEGRKSKVFFDAMIELKKEAKDIRQKIEKDLDNIKKQADALGVKLPVAKYESALEQNKKAISKTNDADPLPF